MAALIYAITAGAISSLDEARTPLIYRAPRSTTSASTRRSDRIAAVAHQGRPLRGQGDERTWPPQRRGIREARADRGDREFFFTPGQHGVAAPDRHALKAKLPLASVRPAIRRAQRQIVNSSTSSTGRLYDRRQGPTACPGGSRPRRRSRSRRDQPWRRSLSKLLHVSTRSGAGMTAPR